jgi:hypothetical protein
MNQWTTPTFCNDVGTTIWNNLAHLLAFNFVIGDNFLVFAKQKNLKCVDFFLFQCVKCMEIVQEDKSLDDYGFFVELVGDEI